MTNSDYLHISQHPIVASKLSQLRDAKQNSKVVRELTRDISILLGYEASADMTLVQGAMGTSTHGSYQSSEISEKVGLIPVLRSGLGFVDGFLNLFPEAPVYHLGIYREKVSHQPVEYYNKLPDSPTVETCFVLDPVIATGNTAIATINMIKEWGMTGSQIKFVSIVGSEQGLAQLQKEHPDIHVFVAAIDKALDGNGMTTLSIFHNPRCSKSRNALAYLEQNKDKYSYDIQVILYQKQSLTREQLSQLSEYLGLANKPSGWKTLLRPDAQQLVSSSEEAYALLEKEPQHLERPFVVDFENKKAALGRPNLDAIEKLVSSL
ncbi:uracil phosphoribosyltransferase-domain-containing protein [Gilbertella persicaria]|uniref:uracil phosphoribosyltransferase-domain-containing protein n=1 Tax=Gilbertella persicaria TaxID=101096 RepID=UPI0022202025|nr:uracil phosphoribosyltransferase-domain-containing protein [Gilbertella persicaria]KAI8080112.1 uracil phosphoribosyltransferase-domain-containing protein [Gilbertella persicaria]